MSVPSTTSYCPELGWDQLCYVPGCTEHWDPEEASRLHEQRGFCHTHWFEMPVQLRGRVLDEGPGEAIEWHESHVESGGAR